MKTRKPSLYAGAPMPHTLVIYRCEQDPLERLNEHLRGYHLESVNTAADGQAALYTLRPDALIAPINAETLQWFTRVEAELDEPNRPLLVLITETPKRGLPADLVLPARWLAQALHAALKLRSETIDLQQRLDVEIGHVEANLEEHRRAAREVDLLRNAIVRTVSHELKTPLLHVKSAVSMLSDGSDQDRHKLIGYATEATARLEGVIKNVTQLAEVLEIKLETMRMADALAQALRNLRRSWEHKDQIDRIRIEISPKLPLVWADEGAIGIVLQHLIDNGLKFSKPNQPVDVTAEVVESHIVVTVRDYGIGIDPNMLDKIFDPFYQIENSDARRFGGVGVGLAIVRLILERHHTTIKVSSEVGKGSLFAFTLPCVE
ncbi:MAG: HAMP domain-containing sensor histidine kinase [Chloroflexota bacterium]